MRIVSTPFCIVTDKCSILSLRPSYPSVYRRCWSGQERKQKYGVAATQDPPSRRRSALHRIRLLPRADRQFNVMKRGDAPSTGRDREFTDWQALADFVDGPPR